MIVAPDVGLIIASTLWHRSDNQSCHLLPAT